MAIAGMILGILATVFALIPLVGGFMAIPCLLVGLPLAGVSFSQARKANDPLGVPIAGIVLNIVGLALTIMWWVLVIIGISL